MTNPNIVTSEDLMQAMDASGVGHVKKKLDEQNIRYFRGVNGAIWTTVDLINAAGGIIVLKHNEQNAQDIL